ncbi:MAG: MmcQ/YjbR family DNA-binding protein [Boseongicola sp.]|nr:MmcQ/YjbR family DNA-binding protein [Boseongicola sp.]MYH57517.1 MmcQ/YjbR family DNA-binding protein [Boseongicola sp. SB0675_bin_26]
MTRRSSRFRKRVESVCAPLPGAEVSDPWGMGHEVWKVGEKIFACSGASRPGVTVKTRDMETAGMLIEAGIGVRAPYFHKSWILLPEDVDDDELRHRLLTSYDLVRASLTGKVQATLPARTS